MKSKFRKSSGYNCEQAHVPVGDILVYFCDNHQKITIYNGYTSYKSIKVFYNEKIDGKYHEEHLFLKPHEESSIILRGSPEFITVYNETDRIDREYKL